ncbi:bifunctional DNA-binding transcriptional regulator/O6-methylguanine-DNA methyltransferase Ada [Mangrovibacter phragmitis]|uniref:bifunctional DNA-binding transcriptional regulator/O6-methylguanine-DNA methyltransferase Ada n=1 Tax=Mangrovibacter phragmitis TaxID=1691903 RepID=UPI00336A54EE
MQLNDEQRWQAVQVRDTRQDGQFVFAVITTGIFCRPSCPARHPLRENVRFFPDAGAAQEQGFRPCKRCQPAKHDATPVVERVTLACRMMSESDKTLSLAAVAQAVSLSPYHFHRQFKSVTGLTPAAWQRALRAQRLREGLVSGKTVTRAVLDAGFNSFSPYYQQAATALGMTGRQFRQQSARQALYWATGDSPLGRCLVARSERGICAVLLGDSDSALAEQLQGMFPAMQCLAADLSEDSLLRQALALVAQSQSHGDALLAQLPLDIRGTVFQQQVWQQLQRIPYGETRTYQQVAAEIGRPAAFRAVASACAANKLALIIPCHRVVRHDGLLAGYRWGVARKAALLAKERNQNQKALLEEDSVDELIRR